MFGAALLVVSSLQCVSDRQFQHLSVSAEQWLPLAEVSVKWLWKSVLGKNMLASCLWANFTVSSFSTEVREV